MNKSEKSEKLEEKDIKDIEEHLDEIKSGKITTFAILGLEDNGNTLVHLFGNATVLDGLLHQAQIQNDMSTEMNLKDKSMTGMLNSLIGDSDDD